jgi:hypothetical protein
MRGRGAPAGRRHGGRGARRTCGPRRVGRALGRGRRRRAAAAGRRRAGQHRQWRRPARRVRGHGGDHNPPAPAGRRRGPRRGGQSLFRGPIWAICGDFSGRARARMLRPSAAQMRWRPRRAATRPAGTLGAGGRAQSQPRPPPGPHTPPLRPPLQPSLDQHPAACRRPPLPAAEPPARPPPHAAPAITPAMASTDPGRRGPAARGERRGVPPAAARRRRGAAWRRAPRRTAARVRARPARRRPPSDPARAALRPHPAGTRVPPSSRCRRATSP